MGQLRADPSKITAVRDYLQRKFPKWVIEDRHETDTIAEVFTIWNSATHHAYLVSVSREFLDDNSPQTIAQNLERWNVGEVLSTSERSLFQVTSSGVSAEEG